MSIPFIIDLATVLDKLDLTKAIATQTSLSTIAAVPIASTLLIIAKIQSSESQEKPICANFLPSRLILFPSAQTPPNENIQLYLYELAQAAQAAAEAQACSSILAGTGSESDDTGDVSFWLGEGEFEGQPEEVIKMLGLVEWAGSGKLVYVDAPSGGSGQLGKRFSEICASLEKSFCFRTSGPVTDGVVIFILVGIVYGQGWGGLVGSGIWSDDYIGCG